MFKKHKDQSSGQLDTTRIDHFVADQLKIHSHRVDHLVDTFQSGSYNRNLPDFYNCPNCGASVTGMVCMYCKTLFGPKKNEFKSDTYACPRCNSTLDYNTLEGDNAVIARYMRCRSCGWNNTNGAIRV